MAVVAQPKRLARALAVINESSVPITPFARRRIGDFTMVESTQIPEESNSPVLIELLGKLPNLVFFVSVAAGRLCKGQLDDA